MRAVLRVLAPLLGIALAAAGVLVVIEVVAAWVLPEHEGGLLVPWPDWVATLAGLSWNQSPVRGHRHRRRRGRPADDHRRTRRAARATCASRRRRTDMTVTTSPRVLARLVGTRVRASDDVLSASVTASARRVAVTARAWNDAPEELRETIVDRVQELLDELPLRRTPARRGVGAGARGRAMTVDLTKSPTQPADPPRPTDPRCGAGPARPSRARRAGDRWLTVLIGLVLLLVGVGVTLLSYGVFGTRRAGRPLLDPIIVDTVAAEPLLWRVVAIVGRHVLAVFGPDLGRPVGPPGAATRRRAERRRRHHDPGQLGRGGRGRREPGGDAAGRGQGAGPARRVRRGARAAGHPLAGRRRRRPRRARAACTTRCWPPPARRSTCPRCPWRCGWSWSARSRRPGSRVIGAHPQSRPAVLHRDARGTACALDGRWRASSGPWWPSGCSRAARSGRRRGRRSRCAPTCPPHPPRRRALRCRCPCPKRGAPASP